MTKIYAIEFCGFRDATGADFTDDNYNADDYLSGYNVVRFFREQTAQDYISKNQLDADQYGVKTAFKVVQSGQVDFADDQKICAGEGDDYGEGYISDATDVCHGYAVPCALVSFDNCRLWTAVAELRLAE